MENQKMNLEEIKNEGIRKNISEELYGRLHKIGNFSESARKEQFKHFVDNIQRIKVCIEECEELHKYYLEINHTIKMKGSK